MARRRRSAEARVASWMAKMKKGSPSPAMKSKLESAREKYLAYAEQAVQIEDSVEVVLNGAEAEHPVPSISVAAYMNFARQVAKAKDKCTGDTVSAEIEEIKTRWAARGIDTVIMARILEELLKAKSAQSRVDNGLAAMHGEAISGSAKRVLDPAGGTSPASTNAYINATEAFSAREKKVRDYLGEQGVKTILLPAYLSFGRQLFNLEHQGHTLNAGKGSPGYLEAAILKEEWTRKGLDPATLEGICRLFP